MNLLKKTANISAFIAITLVANIALNSCEKASDNLGEQFLNTTAANVSKQRFDLVAYQYNNNDTIRTDAFVLNEALIGVFDEPVFGMQKTNFVSQIRPSVYSPNFGVNPVVDSVVLELNPIVNTTEPIVTTTSNIYKAGSTTEIEATKSLRTISVQKYGNTDLGKLTLNVHEVSSFLDSRELKYTSSTANNNNITTSTLLGSKLFDGKIYETSILPQGATKPSSVTDAKLRIALDKNYFKTKFIDQASSTFMSDAASFIRYFKGLRISVAENNGYLFKLNLNNNTIKIYYKSDVTTNNVVTPTPAVYSFSFGGTNTNFSTHTFDRTNATLYNQNLSNITTAGQKKLYLQGCGGAGAMLTFKPEDKQLLVDLNKKTSAALISAKIRITTDEAFGTKYAKPLDFQILIEETLNKFTFIKNINLARALNIPIVTAINPLLAKTSYEIDVTDDIQQIIHGSSKTDAEKLAEIKNYKINIGAFTSNAYLTKNIQYTTSSYDPSRLVFIGTDAGNPDAVKLEITLSKK
jgi:Domain of unknown function (DUF4270)